MVTERWWNYQLVETENSNGDPVLQLKEVYWKQENKKPPKIWYVKDAAIMGNSLKDVVKTLSLLIKDLEKAEVLKEEMLPSQAKMDKEYAKFMDSLEEE